MRRTILQRITTILTLFALVPTAFLLFVLLRYSANNMQTTVRNRMTQEMDSLEQNLTMLIGNIENTANILSSDHTLSQVCAQLYRGCTLGEEIDAYKDMRAWVNLLAINDNISAVRLYLPDSQLVTRQQKSIFALSDLENIALPERMNNHLTSDGWMPENEGDITYYYRATFERRGTAVIALVLSRNMLEEIFSPMDSMGTFSLYYQDTLFYTIGEGGDTPLSRTFGEWRLEANCVSKAFGSVTINPYSSSLLMLFIMLPLIPILAWFFSKKFSISIRELVQANQALTHQEYRHIPEDSTIQEIYRLQQSHNQMVDDLQSMIRDVYEARHARDEAEMTCLFEQVKPHFLYNTLDSGKWLAMQEGAMRTVHFLEKLSMFYRIGLSKGEPFACLSQELEHVRQYVDLMNLRYAGRIRLDVRTHGNANIPILKLILQPLVENAVEHGLHLSGNEGGIRIETEIFGDTLQIDVQDTGKGISEEMRVRLNRGETVGYGIANVRKRLGIYYGEQASICFDNIPNGGTKVSIRLPIRQTIA